MDTYPNPKFTNPWSPDALPVPLAELIAVLTSDYSDLIAARGGPHDAYLLPDDDPANPDSGEPWFCAGIRYGEDGPEYLSPMPDMAKALALWNKYAGPDRQITPAPWFTPVGTVLMVGCLRTEKTKDGYRVTREGDPDVTRYGSGKTFTEAVGDYVTGYPDCLVSAACAECAAFSPAPLKLPGSVMAHRQASGGVGGGWGCANIDTSYRWIDSVTGAVNGRMLDGSDVPVPTCAGCPGFADRRS